MAAIVLLLAPDLGEAGVAGVVLKRKTEEAKAEAATARADLAALRLTVTQQMSQTNAAVAQAIASPPDLGGLIDAMGRWGALAEHVPSHARRTEGARPVEVLFATTGFVKAVPNLLPDVWRDSTVIGVIDPLVLRSGPLDSSAVRGLIAMPDAAIARARQGEAAVSAETDEAPALVAIPVSAPGGTYDVLAVALTHGVSVDPTDATRLTPAAELLATVAAYLRSIDGVRTAHPVDRPTATLGPG